MSAALTDAASKDSPVAYPSIAHRPKLRNRDTWTASTMVPVEPSLSLTLGYEKAMGLADHDSAQQFSQPGCGDIRTSAAHHSEKAIPWLELQSAILWRDIHVAWPKVHGQVSCEEGAWNSEGPIFPLADGGRRTVFHTSSTRL